MKKRGAEASQRAITTAKRSRQMATPRNDRPLIIAVSLSGRNPSDADADADADAASATRPR